MVLYRVQWMAGALMALAGVARVAVAGAPSACTPDAGSCYFPNGAPGCGDVDCCATVCDEDSFCCDFDWDTGCAELAWDLCGPPTGIGACCVDDDCVGVLTQPECEGMWFEGWACSQISCADTSMDSCPGMPVEIGSSVIGSTILATPDNGFPFCGTLITANGVWYSVVGNGHTLRATTCNAATDYDTKISVYCNDCEEPICITGNDDSCTQQPDYSTVHWCSALGIEYFILVHGFQTAVGNFQLDLVDLGLCGDPIHCGPPMGACCDGFICTGTMPEADCPHMWFEGEDCTTTNCGAAPVNDLCADALPIFDGSTSFTTEDAATDGSPHEECLFVPFPDTQVHHDVWYDYVASCTGTLSVSTCGAATYDTKLAIYDGTSCPATNIVACNDDAIGCFGFTSIAAALVDCGEAYKIRVGAFAQVNGTGTGVLTLTCEGEPCPDCPTGPVEWLDPRDGTVDAGRPSDVSGGPLQGIDQFLVSAPAGAKDWCFTMCENEDGGFGPNSILGVTDNGDGTYVIDLARPITPLAVTTITYTGSEATGTFTTHPANANGDTLAAPGDILKVIDYINGVDTPPWGIYSVDVNRSGTADPLDILTVIDLLNGADAFPVYNGTTRPENAGCP